MDMTPQEYQEYVKRLAPKSPIFKDTAFAFFIGGAICALGQLIQNGFLSLGLAKADAGTATSICLIFLSALLTGLNLYNSIARFAGAGTLVRIPLAGRLIEHDLTFIRLKGSVFGDEYARLFDDLRSV